MNLLSTVYDFAKKVLTEPIVMLGITAVILIKYIVLTQYGEAMVDGSFVKSVNFFVALICCLVGVKICKVARAMFSKSEDYHEIQVDPVANAIFLGAVYLSVFILGGFLFG